jgi:hypothetical protein
MPAGDASGRSTSRPYGSRAAGSRAAGAGDSAGAGDRFELDFSRCLALSWPGNTGLEEMLKATAERVAPGTAGSAAPAQNGSPADQSDSPVEECDGTSLDAALSSPFSELAGRVVEDMLPGPGLAGWLSCADAGQPGGLSAVGCSVSDSALWLTWVGSVRRSPHGGALGWCAGAGNVRWSCNGGCMGELGDGLGPGGGG